MKITALETLRLAEHPNVLWVRVGTDEGPTGLGETYFGAAAVEADLHDRIAPLLLGADPSRPEPLNAKLLPYAGFTGTGAEMRALSAVDVALWDLAGKAAGKPLCDLFGGRVRGDIQVYNTCAGPDYVSKTAAVRPDNFGLGGAPGQVLYDDLNGFLNAPGELAASLLEMGISSMKIWPLDFAAGAADGMDIAADDLKRCIAPFERIRAAHGDRMRLKAELHGLWSLGAATRIAKALEPLDMDWIEDPVRMDRFDDLGALSRATSAHLAGGETLAGLGLFRALIETGNIGTPIFDVVWAGGVTAARRVAELAAESNRVIAFHDCTGPVALAVATHLALALENVREQEVVRAFYHGWYGDYVDELPPLERGMITAGPGPGLGMNLLPGLEDRPGAIHRVSRLS